MHQTKNIIAVYIIIIISGFRKIWAISAVPWGDHEILLDVDRWTFRNKIQLEIQHFCLFLFTLDPALPDGQKNAS